MLKIRGTLGWMVMGLMIICCLFCIVSLASMNWRQNPPIAHVYYHTRTWGLFQVKGHSTQTHHQIYKKACESAGRHTTLGSPVSPLAMWYNQKCSGWFLMMLTSYSTAAILVLVVLVQMASMWTFSLYNFEGVKTSMVLGTFSTVLALIAIVVYSSADYQVPHVSVCFWVASFGVGIGFLVSILTICVMRDLAPPKEETEEEQYNDYDQGGQYGYDPQATAYDETGQYYNPESPNYYNQEGNYYNQEQANYTE
eukprot:GHVL01028128.1.p1 GENE.GHVL01028128.1~~GHVL01028128.1.p1  ORF type:complete len:253 (-),score=23.90 GHVL01028128.1:1429-2187(-)